MKAASRFQSHSYFVGGIGNGLERGFCEPFTCILLFGGSGHTLRIRSPSPRKSPQLSGDFWGFEVSLLNENSSDDCFAESSPNSCVKLGSEAADHNLSDRPKSPKIEKRKPFAWNPPEVLVSRMRNTQNWRLSKLHRQICGGCCGKMKT